MVRDNGDSLKTAVVGGHLMMLALLCSESARGGRGQAGRFHHSGQRRAGARSGFTWRVLQSAARDDAENRSNRARRLAASVQRCDRKVFIAG